MHVHGEDDIARLATSFNQMADALQQQIRQLVELSRVQRQFVSDVSHELRTPLTTVRMAGDVLHDSRELLRAGRGARGGAAAEGARPLREPARRPARDQPVRRRRRRPGAARGQPRRRRAPGGRRGSRTLAAPAGRPGSWWRRRHPASPRSTSAGSSGCCATWSATRSTTPTSAEDARVVVRVAADRARSRSPSATTASGCEPGQSAMVFNRFWRADPARARIYRRHRARAGDLARGRPAARRLAAGVGCARRGRPVPADRARGVPATRSTTARCRWSPRTRRLPPERRAAAPRGTGAPMTGACVDAACCGAPWRLVLRRGCTHAPGLRSGAHPARHGRRRRTTRRPTSSRPGRSRAPTRIDVVRGLPAGDAGQPAEHLRGAQLPLRPRQGDLEAQPGHDRLRRLDHRRDRVGGAGAPAERAPTGSTLAAAGSAGRPEPPRVDLPADRAGRGSGGSTTRRTRWPCRRPHFPSLFAPFDLYFFDRTGTVLVPTRSTCRAASRPPPTSSAACSRVPGPGSRPW